MSNVKAIYDKSLYSNGGKIYNGSKNAYIIVFGDINIICTGMHWLRLG